MSAIKSVNSIITIIIGSILIAGISILVIYINISSYNIVKNISINSIEVTNKKLLSSVEDMIDSNFNMIKIPAQSGQAQHTIEVDPHFMDSHILSLLKQYNGLNSIFILNSNGTVVAGFNSDGSKLSGNYSDKKYFKDVMDGKDAIGSNVTRSKIPGKQVFIIASPVFGNSKKIIGTIAVSVDWLYYVNNHVLNFTVGDNGYSFILDSNGRFIAHPNKDLSLTNAKSNKFVQDILKKKNGVINYTFDGKKKIVIFNTIERTGWTICISASVSDLTEKATQQRNILISGASGIFIILLGSIMLMTRKIIINPVRNIMNYSDKVANGDFKSKLEGEFRYELLDLAKNFQKTTDALKNRLGFADGVLKGLTFPVIVTDTNVKLIYTNNAMLRLLGIPGSANDYIGVDAAEFFYGDRNKRTVNHKCIEEKANAIGIETEFTFKNGNHHFLRIDASLIHDLDDNIVGTITLVIDLTEIKNQKNMIEKQRDTVTGIAHSANIIADSLSTSTEKISTQVKHASQGADQQAQRVSETALAMEQMNTAVLEVARNAGGASQTSSSARLKADQGAEVVNKVVRGINELHEQAMALKDGMANLGSQAQSIGQIMTVISDIADQTNLLALNAAIEAARAGESGRGFAVVADEVRKLAEKTMQATHEVGKAIQSIQDGTSKNIVRVNTTVDTIKTTTVLAHDSGEALAEIVALVEQAADQAHSIAAAAEEQSSTSDEVNRAVEQINAISTETSAAMAQSAGAVMDIATQALELKRLIAQID